MISYLNRNCENCMASYASGKNYGYYWCELPLSNIVKRKWWEFWLPKVQLVPLKPKGLCEFCNINSIWYIKK